jgi:hypothetical protein
MSFTLTQNQSTSIIGQLKNNYGNIGHGIRIAMDDIKLTWEMAGGIEREDSAAANPLSRSLNRLFEAGQPFKRFNQCFLAESTTPDAQYDKLWWFGIFILSQGNRIIFFPGLTKTKIYIEAYKGQRLRHKREFDFDHISLDENLNSWHITSQKSKDHLTSFPTTDLGNGRKLWFGMSFSSFSSLWPVSRKTTVITTCPKSDADRRLKTFVEAKERAMFQIMGHNPDADKKFPKGFSHISVIVGPPGFESYNGNLHGFPAGSPFLSEPLPSYISELPAMVYRLALSNDIEMQITIFKLPGALRVPVHFTTNQHV